MRGGLPLDEVTEKVAGLQVGVEVAEREVGEEVDGPKINPKRGRWPPVANPYLRPVSILLVTPPFTQLNTPYPATAYLSGFLRTKDIPSDQMDLGIDVILRLFSADGLRNIFKRARPRVPGKGLSSNARRMLALEEEYLATIDGVIAFLQGKQPTLARQIATENFLPQAGRFAQLAELDHAFGFMGHQDKAKHLATLYLEDLADLIKECVDPDFGFSRYAERLGRSANNFDELHAKLRGEPTFIDTITLELLEDKLTAVNPTLLALSVPFPGNLYAAFRCAGWVRRHRPDIKVALGGGFANTELRSLSDPRVFDYLHYVLLDDGEMPLELLYRHVRATASAPAISSSDPAPAPAPPKTTTPPLKRTFHLEDGAVVYNDFALQRDYRMQEVGTPDYTGLPLDRYLSVIELTNPMHSLWSDGRWNKLTMAHGCYWGKCTFCDVSLDYIGNYQPVAAGLLVDRMEELIDQTGETGFHFVDEAAPPALMRDLALEIIRRRLRLTWWTNIRFEKSFTPDLCRLLQASGCIAVSGGLEVASDRLLALIQKGVTVEQVARVTSAFTEAGILVHSYLMYGYPTQTEQETIDSLEMVRQLFAAGVVQSGFWHRFALTAHSPVGLDPEAYGIVPHYQPIGFANNDVQFTDTTGVDHERFAYGLKKSLFNFMHGTCLDYPLDEWFDFPVPETTVPPDHIARALDYASAPLDRPAARLVWTGGHPDHHPLPGDRTEITLHDRRDTDTVVLPTRHADWLLDLLARVGDRGQPLLTVRELRADFPGSEAELLALWTEEELEMVRAYGLLVV